MLPQDDTQQAFSRLRIGQAQVFCLRQCFLHFSTKKAVAQRMVSLFQMQLSGQSLIELDADDLTDLVVTNSLVACEARFGTADVIVLK